MQPELFGRDQMAMKKGDEEKEDKEESEEEIQEVASNWKWMPSLPCRVENSTGDVLYQEKCPMDFQCNMGPVRNYRDNVNNPAYYTANGQRLTITMCALPGKYFLYQSCKITQGAKVIKDDASQCKKAGYSCDVGPFSMNTEGENYEATFCGIMAMGKWAGLDDLPEIEKRPLSVCRLEDDDGNDLISRACPEGYSCTLGPLNALYMEKNATDGLKKTFANYCEKEEPEWEWTLEETIQMLVQKKGVPAGLILWVMDQMSQNGRPLEPKKVAEYTMKKAKEMMEGKKGEEEEDGPMGGMGNGMGGLRERLQKFCNNNCSYYKL